VKTLRKECPWDREQTHESIRHSLLEETYEVIEAIDNRDPAALRNELGDLLLHIALHSVIASERGTFAIDDVLEESTQKIVRRHPHVFGDTKVSGAAEVRRNWEHIKLQEGRESVLDGVPTELPALLRAHRIQEKASKVGFDWTERDAVWEKVQEEMNELQSAVSSNDRDSIEEELGDVLFALVNYARFVQVNPEFALRASTDKFIDRFGRMEQHITKKGKTLLDATMEEMDAAWNQEKGRSSS